MKKFLGLIVGLVIAGGAFADNNNKAQQNDNLFFAPAASVDIWADYAADSFAGGDGTEASPYRITNAAELAKIAQDVRKGVGSVNYKDTYFVIENDIDLAGHTWFPIGFLPGDLEEFATCEFAGKVDGQGHSIKNFVINMGGLRGFGLFGYTTADFELKNLTILTGSVNGDMNAGSFVGHNSGLIENCVNYVDVTCLQYYAGGIAGGSMSTGKIVKCQNFGKVQAGFDDTLGFSGGGIVGSSGSLIEECVNWGNVLSRSTQAGGIVALMEGGKVNRCFNRGDVEAQESAGGVVGAIAGRTSACEISNCYSTGKVEATNRVAPGGVIGLALMNKDLPLVVKNNYFNYDFFEGIFIGEYHDNFGKYDFQNNLGFSSDEMKAETFVATLNNESDADVNVWSADVNNINEGYPVLEFMKDYVVGISDVKVSDEALSVVAENNSIQLLGEEEDAQVKVFSINGSVVFDGTKAQLASEYFKEGVYLMNVNGKVAKVLVK